MILRYTIAVNSDSIKNNKILASVIIVCLCLKVNKMLLYNRLYNQYIHLLPILPNDFS